MDTSSIHPSWKSFFEREDVATIITGISQALNSFLSNESLIYPAEDEVLRVFKISPADIRVVILGQDPYYNGSAMGLAFSVKDGCKINPSLRNIQEEVKACGYKVENTGDLRCWEKQGVFLLNTALTVEAGVPNSHLKLWSSFTKLLIPYLDSLKIIFLLWGEKAHNFSKYLKESTVVKTSHPSPFSAHRGFIGSRCFLKVNEYLQEDIDWSISLNESG